MSFRDRIKLVVVLTLFAVGILLSRMERYNRFHPDVGNVLSIETLTATVKHEWWIWAIGAGFFVVAAIVDVVKDRRGELEDNE